MVTKIASWLVGLVALNNSTNKAQGTSRGFAADCNKVRLTAVLPVTCSKLSKFVSDQRKLDFQPNISNSEVLWVNPFQIVILKSVAAPGDYCRTAVSLPLPLPQNYILKILTFLFIIYLNN
jgi:hypothetical protein